MCETFRAHHHARRVVLCAPRFTEPSNPPTQFVTFVGFRVFLPPNPPVKGGLLGDRVDRRSGLEWYWRVSLRFLSKTKRFNSF